eukprot:1343341-Pyramimonas_sp.AAC.1
MTARLVDHMDLHKTQRNRTHAVHLRIHARVDKGARAYVQYPKNGHEWGQVVRRVTMNLGDNTITRATLSGTSPRANN